MTEEIRTAEFIVLPVTEAKARKMFQIAGACWYMWNYFREKKLAKVSRKITSIRRDWVHQTTRKIAEKCGTVVLEGLKVKNMAASAKGTIEDPGKNVRQKSGPNRATLETASAQIKKTLEYKCGKVIEVNPEYTSQTCSECGHVDKENRKSKQRFLCVSCRFASNADTSAVTNIQRLGMAQLHGKKLR